MFLEVIKMGIFSASVTAGAGIPDALKNFGTALPEKALDLIIRILLAIVFFVIGVQFIKIIRKIIVKSMKRANAEIGAVQFVDSFLKVAMYVVLVLMLAASFGVDAASIVAVLGSAGVAVGLALQGSLSNLAGGVLILILKPFKVGDYIIEGVTNKEGEVKEIQIFYTKLITGDNKVIILPNGNLANNTLVNVTEAKCRRLDIAVGISYNADIKKAKEALENVLRNDSKVMKNKDMLVVVDELADSYIKLLVRCWFLNEDYWEGKWRITEECKYALDHAGVEIPYPQMDVHVKNIATIVDAIEEK
uniref:mechanosensitive ion channel family protein n=1 Tax=Acetatifactor sp. TaxID=1872090 RepID=UPI004056963C